MMIINLCSPPTTNPYINKWKTTTIHKIQHLECIVPEYLVDTIARGYDLLRVRTYSFSLIFIGRERVISSQFIAKKIPK